MRAVDSGVVVAACLSWHEAHDVAARELRSEPQIAAHAMVEAFSVLTRLPAPHRVPAAIAAEFIAVAFGDAPLVLGADDHRRFVTERAVRLGISGGPIYDALIGETVRIAGATLVTLDGRALATYTKIGCEAALLRP